MTSLAKSAHGESADSTARTASQEQRRQAPRGGLLVTAALASGALFLAMLPASGARAENGPVVVGGSGQPDVQVNWGAMDGGYGGGRRLLMPNSRLPQSGPIVLKPPGGLKAGGLKPPTQKSAKKRVSPAEPATAVTEAPKAATPPKAPMPPPEPKLAKMPPPPPAKKVAPVESAPLPPEKAEAAAPPPPPPPPAAKSAAAKSAKPAAKEKAEAAPPPKMEMGEAPPPPPPPPAVSEGTKPTNGQTAEAPPPPPPPPAAESAPAAGPPPGQVAALPPPGQPFAAAKPTAIGFAVGSASLAETAKERLTQVSRELDANADLRLQIVAYATGNEDNASQARRLSLSRALAVRSFLIDNGVRSTRMDVRALGNKFETGPGDRVDLVIVKP